MATKTDEINAALLKFLKSNQDQKSDKLNSIVPTRLESFDESNETFNTYIQRLDNYFELNNLVSDDEKTDKKKVQLLISCLNPKYFQLLTELTAPEQPKSIKFNILITLLKNHLCPTPNEIAEQHRFYIRNQNDGETISVFVKELRKLTLHCNFNCKKCKASTIDIHLRSQFVRGLKDTDIREKLLQETDMTFDKAVEIAQSMEDSRQGSNQMQSTTIASVNKIQWSQKNTYKNNNKITTPKDLDGKCYRCGNESHRAHECKLKHLTCHKCNTVGHIASVCLKGFKPERKFQKQVDANLSENQKYSDQDDQNFYINSITKQTIQNNVIKKDSSGKYIVDPIINGIKCIMEFDTGASVSSMSIHNFKKLFPESKIKKANNVSLRTYTGDKINLIGFYECTIRFGQKSAIGKLFVLADNVDNIFGREWIQALKINVHNINQLTKSNEKESLEQLKIKYTAEIYKLYSELFESKIGKLPKLQAQLPLQPGSKPVYIKPRIVPYALVEKIECEIKSLEEAKIIERIENTEWGTPIVPILKPDGNVRICADYKITVNSQLQNNRYPIPRIEEIFNKLSGGKYFTTLDIHKAYLHVGMDDEGAKIQAICTHMGTYKVNRLMFGIKTAPNYWQSIMDRILEGLTGVACFFDDIVIKGSNLIELHKRTKEVLDRLKQNNLHVNKGKSKFFETSVKYLGHIVDSDGLHKTSDKIEAILNSPRPTTQTEVKQFLGLINYYYRFIPDLASKLHPLYQLLKKENTYYWTKECEEAFSKIKKEMTSDQVLMAFNPQHPLILATDASPHGLSAVLSHILPNGIERPIAFASRTLSNAEKNYSHIIKEATAIYWGLTKFFHYCYGRPFTLITDNKPLSSILSPTKNLPPLTATRLLHYAQFLSGFNYKIKYRKAQDHVNVDYLSRFPVNQEVPRDDACSDVSILQVQLESLPVDGDQIRKETKKDPHLLTVYNTLLSNGTLQCDDYKNLNGELTIEDGCLFRGIRVVIPVSLRKQILIELHTAHTGITKMKELARRYCWWPTINVEIEEYAKSCQHCAENQNNPPKCSISWTEKPIPWYRLHIDHAGPFMGSYFLILVDAYSKWLEVKIVSSLSSKTTIEHLREIFSRFGLPTVVVSDNGTAYTSIEFQNFMKTNGVKHKFSAPAHPSTNGQAERYVQTVKKKLKIMSEEPGDLHTKVCCFLMQNHKIINMATGCSPSEILLKRSLRTRIDLIKNKPERSVQVIGKLRQFKENDSVLVKSYAQGKEKWVVGTITEKIGTCHYYIRVEGQLWKRHVDQIRATTLASSNVEEPNKSMDMTKLEQVQFAVTEEPTEDEKAIEREVEEEPLLELRRSTRTRKTPHRLDL